MMRSLTGALLILTGEQAFAHAHLINFPHQIYAQSILIPFALVSIVIGLIYLVLGYFLDHKPT